MKRNYVTALSYWCVALLLLFTACSKSGGEKNTEGAGTGIGAKRPVGTRLEAPKTAVIGPAGGTLSSRDNRLKINIPAGALAANTTIGVAAITSTSEAALGNSYELTPHMNFAKPVTVTMSYTDYVDTVGGGCGAAIGYQDSAGVWKIRTNRTVDEIKQTVSVQTNHFSNWAQLTPFRMLPGYSIIKPKEEVILKVGAYVLIGPGAKDPCGFLSANGEDVPVEEYFVVPDHFIDKWIFLGQDTEGAGTLKRLAKGASYTASNYDAPTFNPVTVLAFFRNSVVPFTAKIEVRPVSLGVFINVGTTTYVYSKAYAYGSTGDYGVVWQSAEQGNVFHGGMGWTIAGTGTRNWSDDTQFLWEPEGTSPRLIYQSYWDDGLKVSSGNINITQFGKVGEIVEGTFSISNAGQYKAATATTDVEYIGIKPITGRFRVIRE